VLSQDRSRFGYDLGGPALVSFLAVAHHSPRVKLRLTNFNDHADVAFLQTNVDAPPGPVNPKKR
jgi:hypothetical protein